MNRAFDFFSGTKPVLLSALIYGAFAVAAFWHGYVLAGAVLTWAALVTLFVIWWCYGIQRCNREYDAAVARQKTKTVAGTEFKFPENGC